MKKLIPLIALLFITACKATPIIVDENDPQGYIITENMIPEATLKINIIWICVWLLSVVALVLYTYFSNKQTKE